MIIELSNVGKRFNRDWIFRGVNYRFETGNAYAITGANGSGKSTLLQSIAGSITLSTGDCVYTQPPAFSFQLSGGASETFLRIFFTAGDGTATTLLVHTPDGEWLCETGSPTGYGSGDDPLIDLQFAPPGEYDIWAGTREDLTPVAGTLSITQSVDVTP